MEKQSAGSALPPSGPPIQETRVEGDQSDLQRKKDTQTGKQWSTPREDNTSLNVLKAVLSFSNEGVDMSSVRCDWEDGAACVSEGEAGKATLSV